MRKWLSILFLSFAQIAHSQSQLQIQQNDTTIQLPLNAMALKVCMAVCNQPIAQQGWQQVAGNPVTFSSATATATVISNFSAGITKIAYFAIDSKKQRIADTLTINFLSPCPVCPPPTVCPTPPPPRTITAMAWVNGHWLFTFSDGQTQTF